MKFCEYAINQTNEEVAKPLSISIRDRQTLLQLWVTIKQQLQQSIKSSLSTILGDEDVNFENIHLKLIVDYICFFSLLGKCSQFKYIITSCTRC